MQLKNSFLFTKKKVKIKIIGHSIIILEGNNLKLN